MVIITKLLVAKSIITTTYSVHSLKGILFGLAKTTQFPKINDHYFAMNDERETFKLALTIGVLINQTFTATFPVQFGIEFSVVLI